MKLGKNYFLLLISLFSSRVPAAVLYVDLNSTNAAPPYADWTTAAATIQDAVDAANAGDLILVTNGVYQTGGRIIQGGGGFWSLESQVTMDKPITVESVNGPAFTSIYGQPYWYGIYYLPAMRCVYLADGATLSGFTLTYATAQLLYGTADGGGAFCETTNSIITNCIVVGTSASGRGGGVYGGTVIDSIVSYNGANLGGGAFNSTLIRCLIGTNSASTSGGGVASCALNQCSLAGNTSDRGGAAFQSTLNACVLSQNLANTSGGAVNQCTLSACALFNNSSADAAGAASQSILNHCTLVYNTATNSAGGAQDCSLTNCLVFYNTAPTNANYSSSDLEACCSLPLPAGTNNISVAPVLADNFHLNITSPCIGAGEAGFTFGSDIDGEAWANPPAIGCDEYAAPVNGDLSLQIQSDLTKVFVGSNVDFVSLIYGHASSNRWDFGDGMIVANQTVTAHSWAVTGDYVVEFRVFNDTYPSGVSATLLIHVGGLTNYVSLTSTNPVSPYVSWATAATNIQDAVDVSPRGATVMVDDGVYAVGGRGLTSLTDRVLIPIQLSVKSVNGPAVTTIVGNQVPGTINDFGAVRCVYLADGASLSGFTLTNGATEPGNSDGVYESNGGGVACGSTFSTVSNCVFINNSAGDGGGGAAGGTLNNCVFTGNFATIGGYSGGGGVLGGVLNNCSLSGNYSDYGGGAAYSTLNNCTLAGNSASQDGGGVNGCALSHCTLTDNSAVNDVNANGGGANSSVLNNCTLTGNWAGGPGFVSSTAGPKPALAVSYYGGGAEGSMLNNCTLIGNQCYGGGGGADSSILTNCIVADNSAGYAGGVENCTLNNCTVTGNSGSEGINIGGAQDSTLNNSIVYYNTNGGDYGNCTLNFCCTSSDPGGTGNITNEPAFVDLAGGDLHLQPSSPCINSGNNASVTVTNDLDGKPRIVGGTVDTGAFEYQMPSSILSYAWAQQYGLPTDGSADYTDADGDGMSNWQEWIAGTDPNNSASALRMVSNAPTNGLSGFTVTWQSVAGKTYFVQRAGDLAAQPAFTTILDNITGQDGTTSCTDTTATDSGPYFYRVGVQ